ncbi:MAG: MFS transporter [Chloroflexota bacterium]|jgi:MFS family permease
MHRLRSISGVLRRNPDFARLYLALLIAFAADWFATVALIDLVLETTDSTAAASVILVLQMAPFLLATPIAGMLADRFDRRVMLAGANVARGIICIGLLFAVDADTVWIAFVVVGLLAFGAAFFEPTVSASLPNLVDRADLPTANALIGSAWGTMVAFGAAIGGIVAATVGREVTFLLYPLLFFASGALVWSVKRSMREPEAAQAEDAPHGLSGLVSTITVTVALARRDHAIASLLLTKPTFGVATGIVHMLAITSDDIWGAGQLGVGILFAARGLGALVGPFAARTFAVDDMRRLLRGISISFAIYLAGYALLPLSPVIWAAAVFVFVGHLGGGAQWTLSSFGLQRTTPDRVRGRVFAVDFGLALAVSSISTLTAGWLAGVIGPLQTLYVMLGAMALTVAVWFWWTGPVRRGRGVPQQVAEEPTPHPTPEPPI